MAAGPAPQAPPQQQQPQQTPGTVPVKPGEVDVGEVRFGDLPGAKQYLVVTDVPVMLEHFLEPGDDHPGEYIGPERLAEIAANNNARVERTGDATPLTIGHTKDGGDERRQPPVVGYATNFRVHPLLNSGKQCIHADFHILRDKVGEVSNYPRRSVELWPRKWEIDPIALLGATTPEQDLGLLQLSREGRPRRYRRVFDDDDRGQSNDEGNMAEEKDKKKNDADEPKEPAPKKKPADDGDGGGAKSSLSDDDVQKIIAALMQTSLFKELAAEMGGGAGGQPGDESGMGGGPESEPAMAGGGAGAAPGGEPEEGAPGAGREAAFYHEGPPERYEEDGDCDDPERMSAYASSTNGFVPYDNAEFISSHKGRVNNHAAPGARRMSRMSTFDRYQAFLAYSAALERGEAPPAPSAKPAAPANGPANGQPRRNSRTEAARGDADIRLSKVEQRLKEAEEKVVRYQREKVEAERTAKLRELQAQGWDFEVAEELEDCGPSMTDEQFGKRVEKIKLRYQRSPSGVRLPAPVEDAPVGPERFIADSDPTYASDVGRHMSAGMTIQEAKAAAMKQRGVGR